MHLVRQHRPWVLSKFLSNTFHILRKQSISLGSCGLLVGLFFFFLNCLVAIPDVRCVWNGRLNLYRAITSCIGSGYDAIFNIFTGE